ncbi:putative sodium-dependent multivitamin transporter isoform X2 [Thrips palmi]|uniref:Sodium-dependent multivitamin transporter isoform X2 n=1 Tax=Thrips palmi TaxID=161013 RepID=A0A6P8YME2_THRPL|nr:putative sodium-dependent multivitamin transporter isoform X2 [Thrips palmi]
MESQFGIVDYVVLAAMLTISSSIGLYFRFSGGRQKTNSEFMYADGRLSAFPLACSLMSSFISAVTILGVSAENYSYGTMFVVNNVAYAIGVLISTFLFVPVYFNAGVNGAYQYLDKRFGKATRLTGSVAYSFQMVLYMGMALYAPALALETVTGMSKFYAILGVGLICTFYSTMGGLKAVVFTDVFQSLIMYAAVMSVIVVAWIEKGSLSEIWRIAESHGRIEFNNFSLDPTVRHTWWGIILGGTITNLAVYSVNQGQIQRYISAGTLKTAQNSLLLNWPMLSCLSLLTSFAGLAIFSKYARCDPFMTCKIDRSDQLMPYFVVNSMQHIPGLSGLFVSGIFSAALSTISAAMNSMAVVTLEDYIKPLYKKMRGKSFPEHTSLYAKLVSVMYGFVCVFFAFIADGLGSVLQVSLTILGVVGGPTVGLFTLGMVFPTANQPGALSGFITSLLITFWLGFADKPAPIKLPTFSDGCPETTFGNMTLPQLDCSSALNTKRSPDEYFYLYRLSYMWLSVFGFVSCVVVGLVVSWVRNIFGKKSLKRPDPSLFIPPVAFYLKRKYQINERFLEETVSGKSCL